jgi:hypothetical protein
MVKLVISTIVICALTLVVAVLRSAPSAPSQKAKDVPSDALELRCANLKHKPAETLTAADVTDIDTCDAVQAQKDAPAAQALQEKRTYLTRRCLDLKYKPIGQLSAADLSDMRACQAFGIDYDH